MGRSIWFLTGVATGLAAAYYLDPDRGETRRRILSEQMDERLEGLGERVGPTLKDAVGRGRETLAEVRGEAVAGARAAGEEHADGDPGAQDRGTDQEDRVDSEP